MSHFIARLIIFKSLLTQFQNVNRQSARGVDRRFAEAPHYYWLFTVILFAGAAVALIAGKHMLVPIMLFSQVINGVLLPVMIFFMLKICSDKEIMGEHTNGKWFNFVALISIVMVVLTIINR